MQRVLLRLVRDRAKRREGDVVAIDGKTLRRLFAAATARSPLHSGQAFSTEACSMPGQVRVEARSNEIAALPVLLDILALRGRIVMADAMHTQRTTAATVAAWGGDYVLALKGNQGTLFEDVKLALDDPAQAGKLSSRRDADGAHGRIETRVASVAHDIAWLRDRHDRSALAAIGEATATRETRTGTATPDTGLRHERQTHTGAAPTRGAQPLGDRKLAALGARHDHERGPATQSHGARTRDPACMRRMALNVARNEPGKDAMRGKLKRAGWDNRFLIKMGRAAANHRQTPT